MPTRLTFHRAGARRQIDCNFQLEDYVLMVAPRVVLHFSPARNQMKENIRREDDVRDAPQYPGFQNVGELLTFAKSGSVGKLKNSSPSGVSFPHALFNFPGNESPATMNLPPVSIKEYTILQERSAWLETWRSGCLECSHYLHIRTLCQCHGLEPECSRDPGSRQPQFPSYHETTPNCLCCGTAYIE